MYYTTQQTADLLGVSRRHVNVLIRNGELSGEYFGKSYMIFEERIAEYQNKPRKNSRGRIPNKNKK